MRVLLLAFVCSFVRLFVRWFGSLHGLFVVSSMTRNRGREAAGLVDLLSMLL
jgi:hypothetical protein